jgi:hypothetical protein
MPSPIQMIQRLPPRSSRVRRTSRPSRQSADPFRWPYRPCFLRNSRSSVPRGLPSKRYKRGPGLSPLPTGTARRAWPGSWELSGHHLPPELLQVSSTSRTVGADGVLSGSTFFAHFVLSYSTVPTTCYFSASDELSADSPALT